MCSAVGCSVARSVMPMRFATFAFAILFTSGLLHGQPQGAEAGSGAPSSRISADCGVDATKLPQGYSRVYIAQRNGKDGAGRSWADARDGSTAANFDTVLRCLSEGCPANHGEKAVPKTEKLIVCVGPGVFQTKG